MAINSADQFRLRRMLSLLENRFDALAHVVDAGACRFDQELSVVFAEVEPEEVESIVDVDDMGLLRCEDQSAFLQKFRDQRHHVLFENRPAFAGDHESSHPGEPPPEVTRLVILVRTNRAGERVKASVTRFLARKLALLVNEPKSRVVKTNDCQFLGYTFRGTKTALV